MMEGSKKVRKDCLCEAGKEGERASERKSQREKKRESERERERLLIGSAQNLTGSSYDLGP